MFPFSGRKHNSAQVTLYTRFSFSFSFSFLFSFFWLFFSAILEEEIVLQRTGGILRLEGNICFKNI